MMTSFGGDAEGDVGCVCVEGAVAIIAFASLGKGKPSSAEGRSTVLRRYRFFARTVVILLAGCGHAHIFPRELRFWRSRLRQSAGGRIRASAFRTKSTVTPA